MKLERTLSACGLALLSSACGPPSMSEYEGTLEIRYYLPRASTEQPPAAQVNRTVRFRLDRAERLAPGHRREWSLTAVASRQDQCRFDGEESSRSGPPWARRVNASIISFSCHFDLPGIGPVALSSDRVASDSGRLTLSRSSVSVDAASTAYIGHGVSVVGVTFQGNQR